MSSSMMSILVLVLLIVVMYFLMIRPQKKKEKETQAMRNALQVGDEIVTIGGICGKIVKTKDETIIVQVGTDRTKVEMMRWSVSRVLKEGTGHSKAVSSSEKKEVEEESESKKRTKPKKLRKGSVSVSDPDDTEADVNNSADEPDAADENLSSQTIDEPAGDTENETADNTSEEKTATILNGEAVK